MTVLNNHTISNLLKDYLSSPEMSDINLHSEAVQNIMGRPPQWMIRWGTTLIFIVVLGLFAGSYFFKYPDIVLHGLQLTPSICPLIL